MSSLTVLVDNHATRPGLQTRHGIAFWLDLGTTRLLFDCGSDEALLANAALLGLSLATADLVLLSHGHWDHGGGLPALLATGWRGRLLTCPGVFRRRRAVAPGEPERDVGLAWGEPLLKSFGVEHEALAGPVELASGVWSTGPIGGNGWAPATPALQVETAAGWQRDPFDDEQALVIGTRAGLVVLSGCCHRGLENTLASARAVAGEERIAALVGGLHLKDEPRARCHALAETLLREEVGRVWVNHCTGVHPYRHLKEVLGERVAWAGAGTVLTFG